MRTDHKATDRQQTGGARQAHSGQEAPLRVLLPGLPLGTMLIVLFLVGAVTLVPAVLIDMVVGMAGGPSGYVMPAIVLGVLVAFTVRTLVNQRVSSVKLFEDRLESRWPHPRKFRIVMQQQTVRPRAVSHLERRGRTFQLAERGSSRVDTYHARSDAEADGFWQDLLDWRARAGGLFSFSGTQGELGYSSEAQELVAELMGGAPVPQELRVDHEDSTHWIRGPGLEVKVATHEESVTVTWPGGPELRARIVSPGSRPMGVISTPEGVRLGSWQYLGPRRAQLMLGGREVELVHEVLTEGGLGIAELTYSWNLFQKVRFLSESSRSAVLLTLLALLPSVSSRSS